MPKRKPKPKNKQRREVTISYRHGDRAKWTVDGAKTVLDIAEAFQAKAEYYKQLHKQGALLCDVVNDDYWWFTIPGHEKTFKEPDLPEEVFNKFNSKSEDIWELDDEALEEWIFDEENNNCPVCESENK